MAWKQDRAFNLSKMGTTKNFCLRNVRLAYGIGSKYINAKEAMKANQTNGTLHPMSSIPTNCAVPIFTSAGVFGHVMVYDHGKYYSDGKLVGKVNQVEYKWGETLNGTRIVSYKADPTPVIKVGDTVIVNGAGTATSKGTGAKTRVYVNKPMKVISIMNGRYGLNQYNRNGGITGWWTPAQIKKG